MAFRQIKENLGLKSVQGQPTTIKSPEQAGLCRLYIVNQYGNISPQSANTTITVLP